MCIRDRGSTVVYGRGKAVVTATGMDTEMGKIATAIEQAADNTTPLQKKLNQLSKTLSFLVIGICVFMFVFSLFRAGNLSGPIVLDTFLIAVSLAEMCIRDSCRICRKTAWPGVHRQTQKPSELDQSGERTALLSDAHHQHLL